MKYTDESKNRRSGQAVFPRFHILSFYYTYLELHALVLHHKNTILVAFLQNINLDMFQLVFESCVDCVGICE